MTEPATYAEACRARDEGIERSSHPGSVTGDCGRVDIGETVYDAIVRYLWHHRLFHIDEFWVWAGEHHDGWQALGLDPGRFVGAQMRKVARRGMMAKIDVRHVCRDTTPVWAARPSIRSNLAPKWVYLSLILQDD